MVHREETKDIGGDEDADDSEEDVHKMHNRNGERKTAQCMGCGGNHPRAACRHKNTICRWCRKKGHLAHVCRAAFPEATPPNTEKGSSNHPHSRKWSQVKGKNREEDCFTVCTNPRPMETISHPIWEPSKQENTRDC
ncbi:hypothetical protein E2320_000112 [Naja naja]|nr:hypothetical protein E2320_000112 [Naja naja]